MVQYCFDKLQCVYICECVRADTREIIVSTIEQFTIEALDKNTSTSPLKFDEIRSISLREETKQKK